jgi:hypothetical protein
MTILTSEGNIREQLDKCYVMVDGVFVVPREDKAGKC